MFSSKKSAVKICPLPLWKGLHTYNWLQYVQLWLNDGQAVKQRMVQSWRHDQGLDASHVLVPSTIMQESKTCRIYIPRFSCLGPHFWCLKSLVPWLYIPNNPYIYIYNYINIYISHLINPHLIPKYPQSDPCIIPMNIGGSNGTYTPALPAPPPTSSALLHRGPPEVPLPVQNPSLLWLGKNQQLVT